MTQQVRGAYRKHRRGAWVAIVAALSAATLAALSLPALAVDGPTIQPPSNPAGVVPTEMAVGGDTFDCSLVRQGGYQFKLNNPRSGSYTTTANGTSVTFEVAVSSGRVGGKSVRDKYLSFKANGALVSHVAINGGTKTAVYDYGSAGTSADGYGDLASVPSPLVVDQTYADSKTGLHATSQDNDVANNPDVLYSLSVTTFCFDLAAPVAGTVYHDLNGDGSRTTGANNTPNEPGQPGWAVRAYGPDGVLVAEATSGAGGAYSLGNLPLGVTYTVCEERPGSDTWSGSWGQSTPTAEPANPACKAADGEEARGWQFTLSGAETKDFGNVQTVELECGGQASTPGYAVELGDDGEPNNCSKPSRTEFTLESWTVGNQTYFKFVPYGSATGEALLVERLEASLVDRSTQARLVYDDDLTTLSTTEMPYCEFDPRTGTGVTTLKPNGSGSVGALAEAVLPGAATSCILEASQTVDASTGEPVSAIYFVFSSVDGFRAIPG